MEALGQAVTTVIQQFSKFKNISVTNNDKVSEKIKEIEQQRQRFREFASESIKQSRKLSRYAKDVIIFAKHCANDKFSKDDLHELLKLRLSDARQNKEEIEKLNSKIEQIRSDLADINNCLAGYAEDIKKDEKILLDSEEKEKLKGKETVNKNFLLSTAISASVAAFGAAACTIAAPFSGGASIAAPVASFCAEAGLYLATAATPVALGSKILERIGNREIVTLEKELRLKRDLLVGDISGLNAGLHLVIHTCSKFSTFWEEQIEEIEALINKLEGLNNINAKVISESLLESWRDVNKKCEGYNYQVRTKLDDDALMKAERNEVISDHFELLRNPYLKILIKTTMTGLKK
ncbi:17074_t:CDS:2, partial [Acaulospora colombiana]